MKPFILGIVCLVCCASVARAANRAFPSYLRSVEASRSTVTITFVPFAFAYEVILNGTASGYATHEKPLVLHQKDRLQLVRLGHDVRFSITPRLNQKSRGIGVVEEQRISPQRAWKRASSYFIPAS